MLGVSSGPRSTRRSRAVVLALVAGVALLAVAGLLARTWRGDLPSSAEQADHARALEATVLPVVRDLQVERYLDDDGCAGLTYARGDFVDGDPERCGGSTADPAQFDDVARADHARLATALERSDTPVERTGGTFASGALSSAVFSSSAGAPFATTWELLHEPGGPEPRTDTAQVTFTPVPGAPGWWFACCGD